MNSYTEEEYVEAILKLSRANRSLLDENLGLKEEKRYLTQNNKTLNKLNIAAWATFFTFAAFMLSLIIGTR